MTRNTVAVYLKVQKAAYQQNFRRMRNYWDIQNKFLIYQAFS